MSITSTKLPVHRVDSPPSAEPAPVVKIHRSWRKRIGNAVPNLIVFSFLAGVLYLGHHTGWKMPKLSEFMGTTNEAPDDWCSEHLVPESQCVECQVELLPKHAQFGFCRRHGVAECVICHPQCAEVDEPPTVAEV